MPLIALLALLLFAGVCFLLLVAARILFGALRHLFGPVQHAGMLASGRERQFQSTAAEAVFILGFRKVHLCIFGVFVLVYSLLAVVTWGGYYHTFTAILMTICGPFTTAILDPTPEHWKTAWSLFPICAAFLVWGIFCQ